MMPDALIHSGKISEEQKKVLSELHMRKIDMSDEVYVINKNDCIESSTGNEIEYARFAGKRIVFMENHF